jgi:hypothetical protein
LLLAAQHTVWQFEQRLAAAGFGPDALIDQLLERHQVLATEPARAQEDLRIVETLRLNALLARARRAEAEAKEAHSRAERKLGLARRVETLPKHCTRQRGARRMKPPIGGSNGCCRSLRNFTGDFGLIQSGRTSITRFAEMSGASSGYRSATS